MFFYFLYFIIGGMKRVFKVFQDKISYNSVIELKGIFKKLNALLDLFDSEKMSIIAAVLRTCKIFIVFAAPLLELESGGIY
jgi:hypothetical protein